MAVLTLNAYSHAYTAHCKKDDNQSPPIYEKIVCAQGAMCTLYAGQQGNKVDWAAAWKWNLGSLPSNANVTKVEIRYYVYGGGGDAGIWKWCPYGGNGQYDPEADGASAFYSRAAGIAAYSETTCPRTGSQWCGWETLGDGESAQCCQDLEAAKAAVNRFSLGFYEHGQDDPLCDVYARHASYDAELRITYEIPPAAGYSYGNGFVSVSVFQFLIRKAILSICGRVDR